MVGEQVRRGRKRAQVGQGELSNARDLGLVAIHIRMPFQGGGQGRKLTKGMEKGPRLYCSPFTVEDLSSVISCPHFPLFLQKCPAFVLCLLLLFVGFPA